MRKSAAVLTILVGLLCAAGFSDARAGAAQQEPTTPRLHLGSDQTNIGEQAFVPMMLISSDEVNIGGVQVEITFASRLTSFEEARKDLSAVSADADVSAETRRDADDPENSILEVKIESKTKKAIPSGILAHLFFRISKEATGHDTIELRTKATAFTTDSPPRAVSLLTDNGVIKVIEKPVLFACFFYMH
ncbi:MAG: hypothetical protein HY644_00220 [Acidobacteria bacterium]|nr:hypothetical protein [Acidobacteriota bacterium]